MADADDDRVYSSGEVRDVSGLSYRQLNDWETRGAMPPNPDRDAAWRRFSYREVFALTVCAELRSRFGVSVERLKFVQQFMLQDGADHLTAAVDLMNTLGVGVWLMTDFESVFDMDSELAFADYWKRGYFGGPIPAFAFLKLNPVVNRILATLPDPVHLPDHGAGYDMVRALRQQFGVRSAEEFTALDMIRSGDFDKIEIVLKDGTIDRIKTTSHPDVKVRVAELLQQHKYQKITITQREGQVMTIEQEATTKP